MLTLLGQVEKKAEEQTEKDPDKQSKITEALEAVNGIKSIAPLVPDLVQNPFFKSWNHKTFTHQTPVFCFRSTDYIL